MARAGATEVFWTLLFCSIQLASAGTLSYLKPGTRHTTRLNCRQTLVGPNFDTIRPLQGTLVPITLLHPKASSLTGCEPLFDISTETAWIAVLPHLVNSTCSLQARVRAMQASGASAVILAWDFGEELKEALSVSGASNPISMWSKLSLTWTLVKKLTKEGDLRDNELIIPSAFLSIKDYDVILRDTVLERSRGSSDLVVDEPMEGVPSDSYRLMACISNLRDMYWGIVDYIFNSEVSKTDSELFLEAEIVPIGFYSSLALIGAFLLFPLLFCIGMYSSHALCWLLEWQQLRLSLKKLEIKVLSKGSLGQLRDSICSICRDEYEAGDRVRILCCHHEFHAFCVDRWLSGQVKSCPLCNSRVHVGGMVQDEKLKEGAFVRFFQF